MLPEVGQNIHEGIAHRARRRERAGVIPLFPHATRTAERAVHGARDADREPPDPAREPPPGIRFGDEMDVIVLNRELNDPEILARGNGEGAAHVWEDTRSAQATNGLHRSHRDMHGLSGDVRSARPMRNAGPPASGRELAPGAGTSPAPSARCGQRELNGTTSHRLD